MQNQWNHKIFDVKNHDFETLALDIFRFQYHHNDIYRRYTDALGIKPGAVTRAAEIPFLPVRFFKTHPVATGHFEPAAVFESSGTTGSTNSRHLVKDTDLYRESFTRCFTQFYGPASDYCIIGLLPSYLERSSSSLVYMVNELVHQSGHPQSGFYLYEYEKLSATLLELERQGQKTLLLGVTFALLDFAAQFPQPLQHTLIMETGGMKGRQREMVRMEVHDRLRQAFGVPAIHSEYGMTELLSQAYSQGQGLFRCPPWMQVWLRDEEDPLSISQSGGSRRTGAINIVDLANVYSCSFIATDDAGQLYNDGSFEVLGRIDNSDIRGCSLMAV